MSLKSVNVFIYNLRIRKIAMVLKIQINSFDIVYQCRINTYFN